MILLENLIKLSYWTVQPSGLSSFSQRMWLAIAGGIFTVAIGLFLYSIMIKVKPIKKYILNIAMWVLVFSLMFGLLFVFRYLEMGVLSSRALLLAWILCLLAFSIRVLYVAVIIMPVKLEKYNEHMNKVKYLSKKGKKKKL